MISREDEEIFLKKIWENSLFGKGRSFNYVEFDRAYRQGTLRLQADFKQSVDKDDESWIDQVEKVIPSLRRIISDPRFKIIAKEEKVPIDTVKRINYKAVVALSRDSSDWYDRTALSVRPKNISADLTEEAIDLYENLFIRSLINRLQDLVQSELSRCMKIRDNLAAVMLQQIMSENYNISSSTKVYDQLYIKSWAGNLIESPYAHHIKDRVDRLNKLLRIIVILKSSSFYQALRRKREIHDPIKRTNILLFDYSYNQAYRLWKLLNENPVTKQVVIERVPVPPVRLPAYYRLYCFLCVLAAFEEIDCKEVSKKQVSFDEECSSSDQALIFEAPSGASFSCEMIDCEIVIAYKAVGVTEWHDLRIKPDYTDLDKFDLATINKWTSDQFSEMRKPEAGEHRKQVRRIRYLAASMDFERYGKKNVELPDKMMCRFIWVGNGYSEEENSVDLEQWVRKTGIIRLSPVDLGETIRQIVNVVESNAILESLKTRDLACCPVCGKEGFALALGKDYVCRGCHRKFSITHCSNQECSSRDEPLYWIKYENDEFLEHNDIITYLNNLKKSYEKINVIERIAGPYVTTSFDIVKEDAGYEMKTRCPFCGKQLGKSAKAK